MALILVKEREMRKKHTPPSAIYAIYNIVDAMM